MKTLTKLVIRVAAVVLSLFAAHKLHADPPQAVVWAKHPDAIRQFFPADKYRMLDSKDEAAEMDRTGYMLPHKRDALFNKVGIENKISALDEMDKDMLVMTARFEDEASVQKHYPMLSPKESQKLVREVQALAAK